MSYFNTRRKLEVALLLAVILLAFAAVDSQWIGWVSHCKWRPGNTATFAKAPWNVHVGKAETSRYLLNEFISIVFVDVG